MKFVLILVLVTFAAIIDGHDAQQFGYGQQPLVVGQQYHSPVQQYPQPVAQQSQSLGYYWPPAPRPQRKRGLDGRTLLLLMILLNRRQATTTAAPTAAPTVAPTTDKCTGYTTYLSCCYKYYSSVVTWTAAKTSCEAAGGMLANVGVRDDTNRRAIFSALGINSQQAWIGATDADGLPNPAAPVWISSGSPAVSGTVANMEYRGPNGQAHCGLYHLHQATNNDGITFDLCDSSAYGFVCEKC